jgi:hypothetical protein
MTQTACTYSDRDAVLVAYLYDDIDAAERIAFETHVMTCLPCRSEIAQLRHVRTTLGQWVPPETTRVSLLSPALSPQSRAWWHAVPVWAQVAAAMLVLGVSASIANLDVRYDKSGLNVRTGWSKPAAVTEPAAQTDTAPWRAEMAALQSQLQSEIRTQAKAVTAVSATPSEARMSDAEFSRRVRVLLDENQKTQDQNLAVHLVQLQRDFEAQRQADLRRTNQLFRQVTSTYGDEIAKHERQINYLLPNSQR